MSASPARARAAGLTLGEIAALTGATPSAGADLACRFGNIAALEQASPGDLSLMDNLKYAAAFATTRAGAILVSPRFAKQAPAGRMLLVTPSPYAAFVKVARVLFEDMLRPASLFGGTPDHPSAPNVTVHPTARLESGVVLDPGATVGPDAEIGTGSVIGPGAAIGPGVRIGRHCAIGAGATVTHAFLGDRVIVHPGCRIGQDGFGYLMGAHHTKVPQIGRVIVQDDVEIGANTTIDRGANRDTVIGEGTKIDNLVQVGHNVVIGRHCIVVAQSGLSGSTTLGDHVVLGARAATNNHVTIGEGAQIAAISVVNDDVPAGARWGGTPAKPIKQWFREMKTLEQMAQGARGGAASTASDGRSED